MKRLIIINILFGIITLHASAQELKLHYDFSSVKGTTVTDMSASGIDATLRGSAKVQQMGKYQVLNLGTASGYLDMGTAVGNVFRQTDNYTISVYYRVDDKASLSGNGHFLWAFSTLAACTSNAGKYTAYRLNAQRVATSTGGYGSESGIQKGSEATKGKWEHMAFVQSGNTGRLYINGEAVGATSMPINSANYGEASITCCWIGRPPFSGDAYLTNTLVYDFRLYDSALTTADIKNLATVVDDLEYEMRYGGDGDFTALKAAVESAETWLKGLDTKQYPPSAILEFQDAINMANYLITENRANQTTIDQQRTALTTARSKLTATRGKTFDTTGIHQGYDTNRGFIHPGGLHTEADFIRIRRQLAEGNPTVKAAYDVLKSAEYSQASCPTWPGESIVRGGDGQNYINAARGATIAYQNALRWKIDGTRANADNAVKTLMAWAKTTKVVTGTSDASLAYGIYGYEFAQAAELMRDYDGWSRDDFETFKRWMLDVWYPGQIGFMRGRNGTWENAGKWWQAPGHYWSNWGLCNALALLSVGVLCDDVFIYNQGLSFMKHDQVGTFTDPRTADPILNDGLTEFLGNLVVTTYESDLETGAYGRLGQMNESGRDGGHAAMALGLAVDIAHMLYNQGDDFFAFMDHRLAAGIEYTAAQTQATPNLPWVNYHYANNGYFYTDGRSWLMTGPAPDAQIRPYWGTVIGHYEGVKGVKMPFSEKAYQQMGIDGGGLGGTSGGYDHLGYSVLMNTRDGLAPANQVPTELSGKVAYGGVTYNSNEAGGLENTFRDTAKPALDPGTQVTLMPQLPKGETDTGKWVWTTGETTRNITVTANNSHVYRVTYTNQNGVESQQVFTLAVTGDCQPTKTTQYINGSKQSEANVYYGSEVTLSVTCAVGWNKILWDNGETSFSTTIPNITTSRDIQAIVTNQGGRKQLLTFHLNVQSLVPSVSVSGTTHEGVSKTVVDAGADVVLSAKPAGAQTGGTYSWSIGEEVVSEEPTLTLADLSESTTARLVYSMNGETLATIDYELMVHPKNDAVIEVGNYLIYHPATNTYLTNTAGADASPSLQPLDGTISNPSAKQVWNIYHTTSTRYDIISMADSLYLSATGAMVERSYRAHRITTAAGTDYIQFYNSTPTYWTVERDGTIGYGATDTLTDFPFRLIAVELPDDIHGIISTQRQGEKTIYNLQGQRLGAPSKGLNIIDGKKILVK